ncbi:uncharacterized protein LOC128995417 [Macrosteles quadrilineatus]|uniref:uncharacterized protein LOC128995417 n=1 Tax=Macrosteles quadrilineatus TaxID=74068 RepID=UPI0023E1C110|nr:uncharacterized protein LOC128995417 [Macrosteles quadrilineatus]
MEIYTVDETLSSDSGEMQTVMTKKEHRLLTKKEKIAAGIWVPNRTWKRRKRELLSSTGEGLGFSHMKMTTLEDTPQNAQPSPLKKYKSNTSVVSSTGEGLGVSHMKMTTLEDTPQKAQPSPLKKYKSNTTLVAPTANEASCKNQAAICKMAVAPAAYPDARFSAKDCEKLQDRLMDLVLGNDNTKIPLQFIKTYPENGALVFSCGNIETVDWLKGVGPNLALEGEGGTKVIVADYRDLLRTTKVFLRTDKRMAKMDATQVLNQVQRQNHGLTTEDWRVIGGKKKEDHRTLVLAIDETSAKVLKDRGWRIYLGLGRVQLIVLAGASSDDRSPKGEPTTQ